jgi:hypothetical protein
MHWGSITHQVHTVALTVVGGLGYAKSQLRNEKIVGYWDWGL